MKAYCKHCGLIVEALNGYYYYKCPHCYNPLKLDTWNKLKVFMGVEK